MGILHYLAGDGDILLEGLAGRVDHHGGKAPVNAALTGLKAVAVVQMEHDGQAGLNDGGLHQLHQIGVVGIGAGALGYLKDQRGLQVGRSLGDTLHDLHVVDVEGADGVTAVISLFKHFLGSYQWHIHSPSSKFCTE